MKPNWIFLILLLVLSSSALACPFCGGASVSENNQYTVYWLAGFIILTYIPFYLMYRLAKKGNKLKKTHD